MNIVKKIFCRVYQFAFHIALPVLPYREPEILKSTDEIAAKIKEKGPSFGPFILYYYDIR